MPTVEPHQSNRQKAHSDAHFVIGQDATGYWLAVETHGLSGGLFRSCADAIHFVEFETGHRPGAFEVSPEPLQLAL